jgi:hypothetical protein
VPDDHFPGACHARADEPEFAPAVCGLVQIHEVHVDGRPGDVPVELGVQVGEGLLERAQPCDPHLGRGEGVHPEEKPDAARRHIGFLAKRMDRTGRGQNRLEHDVDGDSVGLVKRLGDLAGILVNLVEGVLTIQVLAAGNEPNLKWIVWLH